MSTFRRIRKTVLPTCVFAVVVFLAAWLLNHIGSGGPGVGTGPAQSSIQTASGGGSPAASSGVMEVTIRDDRYLVEGRELPLEQVVQAAAAHANRVRIIPGPDSRLGSELDLKRALEQAGVHWESVDPEPNRQP